MEGFPRDVQTLILRELAGTNEPGRLYDLFSTNHMFRTWVTRFVWDYCVPVDSIYHYRVIAGAEKTYLIDWDVIGKLKAQWESQPTLFVSFCMYAHVGAGQGLILRQSRVGQPGRCIYAGYKARQALFYKRNSYLGLLNLWTNKRHALAVCSREIDKYEGLAEKHRQSLERAQERIEKNQLKRGPLIKDMNDLEVRLAKKAKVKKTKVAVE